MQINLRPVTIRSLVEGYSDNQEEGVVGLGGWLNIRPPYQREFVYKDKQRDAVIHTVRKGFPLNVMYWVISNKDGLTASYEVLDGQQRAISVCQYVNGDYSVDHRFFHNLNEDEQNQILDYELMVYFCEGTENEKLDWFETINIAGEKLTKQELRNAVYTGAWLSDAKSKFSRSSCPAYMIGSDYVKGTPIRQDYLQEVLSWISEGNIEDYMATHQHDANANELWVYFNSVINWVKVTFPNYRKEMKGVNWGALYNVHKDVVLNVGETEAHIVELLQDEDVTKKAGVYQYILTGKEKYLNIRAFTDKQKREAYERQGGVCNISKEPMDIKDMEADHITPWSLGGKTTLDNCQMISKEANRLKSNK